MTLADRAVVLAGEVKQKPRPFDFRIWVDSSDLKWHLVQEEPDPRSRARLVLHPVTG